MSIRETKTTARAETVARAALALVDSGGLESLTMRKLATSLDMQLPTIYRLFDGKQALIDEMAEVILAEVPERMERDGADWRARAADFAKAMRSALLAHRDGARIVGGSYTTKRPTLTVAEEVFAIWRDAGFSPESALLACTTLFCYVLGEVLEQQGADGVERGELLAAVLPGAAYPHVATTPMDLFFDFEARFEFGLRVLLAGLSAELR
ncbi:TetR/AcrR family transcriptional regulator C-terminal domain-containing protein [Sciscionella sediminilitoris]|uniref:TetR/AcrR family transcriptional regulator C-terminal domain-containing protein n=1 Tax=Sciscionella sediminilitoris TaxID=1445613 RepID=UPI0018D164E2|nr:TetR/AcrR family transcriptional regulator C-terminal domain-containing protein [Sciscionella sp. SE31]